MSIKILWNPYFQNLVEGFLPKRISCILSPAFAIIYFLPDRVALCAAFNFDANPPKPFSDFWKQSKYSVLNLFVLFMIFPFFIKAPFSV